MSIIDAQAVRLRSLIRSAEAKADDALLAKAELLAGCLRARQLENHDAPHLGQKAIIRLVTAIDRDVEAANNLFRTHDELVQVGREMGGRNEETPDSGLPDRQSGNLTA